MVSCDVTMRKQLFLFENYYTLFVSWPEGWLRSIERENIGWWTSPPVPILSKLDQLLTSFTRIQTWLQLRLPSHQYHVSRKYDFILPKWAKLKNLPYFSAQPQNCHKLKYGNMLWKLDTVTCNSVRTSPDYHVIAILWWMFTGLQDDF